MPRKQQPDSTAKHASTILVVEDDAAILDVLCNILSDEGFNVAAAAGGAQALERAENEAIDLVVLDLMLPDVSGHEVCRSLRMRCAATLPIIMLTALGTQEQVNSGLELGADDYMAKPFDPRELVLRISGLLRRSQQAIAAERALAEADYRSRAQADAAQVDAEMERMLRRELLHNVTTHMHSLSRWQISGAPLSAGPFAKLSNSCAYVFAAFSDLRLSASCTTSR